VPPTAGRTEGERKNHRMKFYLTIAAIAILAVAIAKRIPVVKDYL
jgi:hypothetical protein